MRLRMEEEPADKMETHINEGRGLVDEGGGGLMNNGG